MKRIKELKKMLCMLLICSLAVIPVGSIPAKASVAMKNGGSDMSHAVSFNIGQTVSGSITEENHKKQYYKFSLPQNACVRFFVKTRTHEQGVVVKIYDSNAALGGKKLEYLGTSDENNWGYQSTVQDVALSAGTYYLEVSDSYYSYPDYTIKTSIIVSTTDNVKVAAIQNKSFNTAVRFSIGNQLKSHADYWSSFSIDKDTHKYVFYVPTTQTVRFKAKPIESNYEGRKGSLGCVLYDSSGKQISVTDKSDNSVTLDWDVTVTLKKGTYYIGVCTCNGYYNGILYTIDTSYYVKKVSGVKVTSPSKNKMKITWNKVSGSGYEVQYCLKKNFKGSKVYKKVLKGSSKKSYTKSGLKRKKRYYVRVRGYSNINGKKINGSWSKVTSVKIK